MALPPALYKHKEIKLSLAASRSSICDDSRLAVLILVLYHTEM